jgi:hypothetical protein
MSGRRTENCPEIGHMAHVPGELRDVPAAKPAMSLSLRRTDERPASCSSRLHIQGEANMTTRRLLSLATIAVLTALLALLALLRLAWRLRILVVVVLLALLMQHMYCQHRAPSSPRPTVDDGCIYPPPGCNTPP